MVKEFAANHEFKATITSEKQITLPPEVVEMWGLKPGDQISVVALGGEDARIRPSRRRSIFDRLDEFKLPSLGRPVTQADIEDAIAEEMNEQEERCRGA